jgi:hypothetical protein
LPLHLHCHMDHVLWYGSALWYNPSKVRFRFWRKSFTLLSITSNPTVGSSWNLTIRFQRYLSMLGHIFMWIHIRKGLVI